MKVNKAFRIPFITKKQLKSRVFAENFLEAPIQSIQRCLNPLFQPILFWCSLFFKNISTPRLEPTNGVKQCCLPSLPFKISLNIYQTLTFIRHLTLINSNLMKQKKMSLLFWIKFKQFNIFSAYSKFQCVFTLYVHFSL